MRRNERKFNTDSSTLAGTPRRRPSLRRRTLLLEQLETRCLPSSYFVATTGSDDDPGTFDAPFHTIQRAASIASAGDIVYIREGIYRETVTPAHSGTVGAPITFLPYNGETVAVSGADLVDPSTWNPYSGSIYQAPLAWTLGDGDQVFVDGQMMNDARFPNTSLDLSYPNLLAVTTATHSGSGPNETATIRNAALNQPTNFWAGATLHIRMGAGNWVQTTQTVDSSAPGSLTFHPHLERVDTPSDYEPRTGNVFWLSGRFQELDTEGEYFIERASSTLSLWTPTDDSPANHVVEAKHRELAFNLNNRSYITVQGLNLFASTIDSNTRSTNITLDGITAQYVSHYTTLDDFWSPGIESSGIMLRGDNCVVQNSTIAYSAGNGLLLMGNNDQAINNVIHDVNYEATDTAAINTGDASDDPFQNNEIGYNTIYNTGRAGILFATLQSSHLHHNLVHDVLLQSQDSGALYTWNRDGLHTRIDHNIIYNVSLNWNVTWASAIHLDDNSKNYIVDHNVDWNSWNGLLIVPNNDGIEVYNNTIIGTDNSFVSWPSDFPGTHIIFINNIFTNHVEWTPSQIVNQNNLLSPSEGGADPQFVDPASNNYQLGDGSPAIAAGIEVPPYTDGYPGPAPDLGAYWYGVPPWQAGAGTGPGLSSKGGISIDARALTVALADAARNFNVNYLAYVPPQGNAGLLRWESRDADSAYAMGPVPLDRGGDLAWRLAPAGDALAMHQAGLWTLCLENLVWSASVE